MILLSGEGQDEILADFGLTPNQVRVYTAILQLHMGSVGAISKLANVRREDVYRMIPKLEKMGLVEKVLGTPAKIKAIPAESAFAILIERARDDMEKQISAMAAKSAEFFKLFKARERNMPSEDEGAQFSLISEKHAILSRCNNAFNSSQRSIKIVESRKRLMQLLFVYGNVLHKALRRGVEIHVVTEKPEKEDTLPRLIEEQLSPKEFFDLRYLERVPSHYMIIDDKDAYITTSRETLLAESPSLWTNNSNLLSLVQQSFEGLLQNSLSWTAPRTRASVREKTTRAF